MMHMFAAICTSHMWVVLRDGMSKCQGDESSPEAAKMRSCFEKRRFWESICHNSTESAGTTVFRTEERSGKEQAKYTAST